MILLKVPVAGPRRPLSRIATAFGITLAVVVTLTAPTYGQGDSSPPGPGWAPGIGNRFLYTGRESDSESGVYSYRTRYVEPMAGRFTTRDTIGTWGDVGSGGNAFAYSNTSPSTRSDAYGDKAYFIRGLRVLSDRDFDSGMHDLYNRYTGQKSHDAARYFDGWNVVDEIVEVIVKVVKADCDEPIILAGHSYGGVSALQVARKLEAKKVCCSKGGKTFDLEITISLLLLVDAVAVGREGNARDIPSNVARTVNWYQKKGLVHGQAVSGPATVVNRDWTGAKFSKGGKVTREEISHTNIDDDEVFQDQAIREINAHDRFRDPTKWAR